MLARSHTAKHVCGPPHPGRWPTMAVDGLRQALSERYTIERELGRGGMATVYLATDVKGGRRVAIKVLLPLSEARRVGKVGRSRLSPSHYKKAMLMSAAL